MCTINLNRTKIPIKDDNQFFMSLTFVKFKLPCKYKKIYQNLIQQNKLQHRFSTSRLSNTTTRRLPTINTWGNGHARNKVFFPRNSMLSNCQPSRIDLLIVVGLFCCGIFAEWHFVNLWKTVQQIALFCRHTKCIVKIFIAKRYVYYVKTILLSSIDERHFARCEQQSSQFCKGSFTLHIVKQLIYKQFCRTVTSTLNVKYFRAKI